MWERQQDEIQKVNNKRLIGNLRQMRNRGNKLDNSQSFGEGSETVRHGATWLSMRWATTVCGPHDLYGSAEQDLMGS